MFFVNGAKLGKKMIQYASTWTHHCILIVKFCLCPVFWGLLHF